MRGRAKWILATAALAAVAFWFVVSRDVADPALLRHDAVVPGAKGDVPSVRSKERAGEESRSSGQADAEVSGEALKVHEVLRAEGESDERKLDELMRLLPTLGEESQIEVAEHVSNLCEDDQVDRLLPLMKNGKVALDARQALFDNLFNRGPDISLPVLLRLAEGKDKLAEQARESLQQLLGEDHGADMAAWRKAVEEELEKFKTAVPEEER